MQKIIFATGNRAKLDQIRFIIERLKFSVEIVHGREVCGDKARYEEIGETVEQIALNGAVTVAKIIGSPVITEDTDLRIEALNGEPGIRAGEFLKIHGRAGILERMRNIGNRTAAITSAVAWAAPEGTGKVFLNKVEGRIAEKEKFGNFPDWIAPTPENAFGGGYNAIFIPDGWSKTLAEISPEEAVPWSYREKNFIDMIRFVLGQN